MKHPKVGLLLVVTNEEEFIPLFMKAFKNQTYKNTHLYILDNNCTDNSISLIKSYNLSVTIIKLNETTGFAHGNNLLAERAVKDNCEYIFVLNPDIEMDTLCVEELVKLIESDINTVAVAPIMFYGREERELNKIQSYADYVNFKKRRVESLHHGRIFIDGALQEVIETNVVSGGITFIRSDIVKKIGLFDEVYYIYGEEVDLALRIKKLGLKLKVTSKAKVWHHHNWSPKNIHKHMFSYYYMNRSQVLYFIKYHYWFSLFTFLIKEFSSFPFKYRWSKRMGGAKLFKFYYLGLFHGLLGRKGKANLNFD